MGESRGDNYCREACDIKHKALEDRAHSLEEDVSTLKADLEKRMDKLDSKVNGLIMTLITTLLGTLVAVGGEFIKKFVK